MSLRTPRCFFAIRENSNARALKVSWSVFASHGGSIAGENACRNGCISVEEISCFSYQVAVGRTISDSRVVEVIRKSEVTSRSSLPWGASSTHLTSLRVGLCVFTLDVVHATDEVLQEAALTLCRGTEEVRTPQGQGNGAS